MSTGQQEVALDVIVIGGGQAGLAVARELGRTPLSYVVLDAQPAPGGAWRHGWDSLNLFSPARWSSLPGLPMPGGEHRYPGRDDVVRYLEAYEARYGLRVQRPVRVRWVRPDGALLRLGTDRGTWRARAVVSATGTFDAPHWPEIPGRDLFQGRQLHSSEYRSPAGLEGQRVIVVGGGNSGAQIVAEVSRVAHTTWATLTPPSFMPDDIDGRVLFGAATQRYRAQQAGSDLPPPSLGDIVMVPSVREARERGVLGARAMFVRVTAQGVVWPDGATSDADTIIWCTGFRPALQHLDSLGVLEDPGYVRVQGTRSRAEPRLWLVGYGNWTGFASATLVGVGRSARATVAEVVAALR
ncbi:cation diffusion facilitator CzcD-associated flavoprotein CzcO [Deinobacterium chartae]|uniref:Cation diffusion facilitator CzcD-associated flavoprotein CzcO n=1 Tax=Deinobacterium chartae TaxID=521158 RepID=A0A841I051_9DEIO|nr:ArsO family NAD(P)H-dependent flavin-containing monooxygenase [Deinobacterium chartae]MBB6097365.1 cation diffusion facilitator CzcD-associated flavoprotein CzcO [Deinobacterium chartae]